MGEDASRGRPGNRNRQGRARPILNKPRRIVENRRRDEAIIILRRLVTIAGIGGLRQEYKIVAEAQFHIDLEHIILGEEDGVIARRDTPTVERLADIAKAMQYAVTGK